VPEGEYVLSAHVKDAAHANPGETSADKTSPTYMDASKPIVVHGEMNGVVIQMNPKTKTP
jgi:hypothetical protein